MKWFRELIKDRSLRRYLHRLPPYLSKVHGKQPSYSPKQVSDAIKALKLNEHFVAYAVAALSDNSASQLYAKEMQLNEDTLQLRQEIAETYLDGDPHFTIHDLNVYAGVADTGVDHPAVGE